MLNHQQKQLIQVVLAEAFQPDLILKAAEYNEYDNQAWLLGYDYIVIQVVKDEHRQYNLTTTKRQNPFDFSIDIDTEYQIRFHNLPYITPIFLTPKI